MDPAAIKYSGYGGQQYYSRQQHPGGVFVPFGHWNPEAGTGNTQYSFGATNGGSSAGTIWLALLTGFFLGQHLGEKGERRRVIKALNLD